MGLCARRAPLLTGQPQRRIGCSSAWARAILHRARSSPWRTAAAASPRCSAPAASRTTTPAAWREGTVSPATSAAAWMTWASTWTCPACRCVTAFCQRALLLHHTGLCTVSVPPVLVCCRMTDLRELGGARGDVLFTEAGVDAAAAGGAPGGAGGGAAGSQAEGGRAGGGAGRPAA